MVVFLMLGVALGHSGSETSNSMLDLKGVYYPAKCLLKGCDPYNQRSVEELYLKSVGDAGTGSNTHLEVVTRAVNLPTTLLLIAPLALLPWSVASWLWMILIAGGLILAAWLIWSLSEDQAPLITGVLLGLLLANSVLLLALGNMAGLVVSFCAIAVWCFVRERFLAAGVLCMAISLAIKPHDSGLVWFYFLLAGATYRKRALQTLGVVLLITLVALFWVSYAGPHWFSEMQSNLTAMSAQFGLNDPGPTALHAARDANMVISLQAAISIFYNNPRFYNPVSYLISVSLFAVWLLVTIKAERSLYTTWLALAAIVPITLLSTYHRPHDAGLLMLTLPAAAELWARGGSIRRLALTITLAAFLLIGTIPLALLLALNDKLHLDSIGILGKVLTMLLARPLSIISLLMSVFYLWVYVSTLPSRQPTKQTLEVH
jgi:hypothetical protein